MTYLDIISLEDAKNYLRVDDTLTEDDAQITLMINSAFTYIENHTNIMLRDRDKSYNFVDCFVRVYDHPINSTVAPTEGLTTHPKTLYTNFVTNDSDTTTLTLNVGYMDSLEIPPDLVVVAYKLIEMYYYQKQTGEKAVLDDTSIRTLDQNKRFYL